MSDKKWKPMLSGKVPADLDKLDYPKLVSPKLDGIRCIARESQLVSRTLKPIPNKLVQAMYGDILEGLDGELIMGSPCAPDCYRKTNSAVMSHDTQNQVSFYVFDHVFKDGDDRPFDERLQFAKDQIAAMMNVDIENVEKAAGFVMDIHFVPHVMVHNAEELRTKANEFIEQGYEGIMLRDPTGPYKNGRSTTNEGILLKMKNFSDSEAVIEGFEPLMRNLNEATTDALGHTVRSSHKDNKVADELLGALLCRDVETGIDFKIGTGFDEATRIHMWENRDSLTGQLVKYKYFDYGVKEKPRHPVFLGMRDPIDMGEPV